ncbi:hypothetical protein BT69DRAFT_1353887 [Atractiella rhizophila]|nr:hypothetical protein BT69DRAFT_1353887 [Atractiella rhizophila]
MNLSGTLNFFRVFLKPNLVVPDFRVRDIRSLNFPELKRRGVIGVVFDKDNCLTLPHKDQLVPALNESYASCLDTFGRQNVLLVSNSAGTVDDSTLVQAELVSRSLYGVPVLVHKTKKPGCWKQVDDYFRSLHPPPTVESPSPPPLRLTKRRRIPEVVQNVPLEHLPCACSPLSSPSSSSRLHASTLTPSKSTPTRSASNGTSYDASPPSLPLPSKPIILIVGDRVLTDVVLSSFLLRSSSFLPLSVLTTSLWAREGVLNTFVRWLEDSVLLGGVMRMKRSGWVGPKHEAEIEKIVESLREDRSVEDAPVVMKKWTSVQAWREKGRAVYYVATHPVLAAKGFAEGLIVQLRIGGKWVAREMWRLTRVGGEWLWIVGRRKGKEWSVFVWIAVKERGLRMWRERRAVHAK